MEQQALLSANYLDILFDQRNKAYGGYELRSNYPKRLRTALFTMLFSAAALSIYSVFKPKPVFTTARIFDHATEMTDLATTIKPPEVVVQPPAAAKPNTAGPSVPEIVRDDKVPDVAPRDLSPATTGSGHPDGNLPTAGDGDASTITTSSIPVVTTAAAPVESKPIGYAEQMPEFEGTLNSYLSSNLKYPSMARENNIEGSVIVRFVVNEDGSIDDVSIIKGIGGGCNEEAARVVRNMPRWKPGRQNGKAVKVFFTLPVSFRLQ